MEEIKNIPVEIYTEATPNPLTMKFVANKMLVEGPGIEFTDTDKAKASPLAQKLFLFPFVTNVFLSANFITVTRTPVVEWDEIVAELRDFIKKYINSGEPLLAARIFTQKGEVMESVSSVKPELVNEIDIKINNILEEYIRPAVEQDGGAIVFRSYKDGVVTVALQGSCSGCPSSRVTLKSGIEGLLKRMIPEVHSVVAEEI